MHNLEHHCSQEFLINHRIVSGTIPATHTLAELSHSSFLAKQQLLHFLCVCAHTRMFVSKCVSCVHWMDIHKVKGKWDGLQMHEFLVHTVNPPSLSLKQILTHARCESFTQYSNMLWGQAIKCVIVATTTEWFPTDLQEETQFWICQDADIEHAQEC